MMFQSMAKDGGNRHLITRSTFNPQEPFRWSVVGTGAQRAANVVFLAVPDWRLATHCRQRGSAQNLSLAVGVRSVALWQFELTPIPVAKAMLDGVSAIGLSQAQLDEIDLDLPASKQASLFSALCLLLPEKPSWHAELRIWGDEKADDVQVYLDGSRVEFVQFRLDVSDLSFGLVGGFCAIARDFGWVFVTKKPGALIQPTREAIVRAAVQSPAAKFVRDPKAYIEQAVRADQEPS